MQPSQSVGCDFLLFTDEPRKLPREYGWKVKKIRNNSVKHLNGPLLSRYPKILSHLFFSAPPKKPVLRLWQSLNGKKHYEYTIYIDANAQILTSNFAQEAINYLKEYQIALFIHPDRDCIYDEGVVLENDFRFKGKGYPFLQQIESYRDQGYPEHNGLLACGVIVRNTSLSILSKVENDWWNEVNRWTFRDQLSFPYVLWKNKYKCDMIQLNLWNNHLVKFVPHL